MDFKSEIIRYLRNKRWNSAQLEDLVYEWEGPVLPLWNAALKGRVALMALFDPILSEEDCEVAADLICPIPEPPLR